jgi:hypothetical protein
VVGEALQSRVVHELDLRVLFEIACHGERVLGELFEDLDLE